MPDHEFSVWAPAPDAVALEAGGARHPMTRSGDGTGYTPRRLDMDGGRLRDLRSVTIDAALTAFDPDLLIVDRHPFGIDGELRPVLANLRARGTAWRH